MTYRETIQNRWYVVLLWFLICLLRRDLVYELYKICLVCYRLAFYALSLDNVKTTSEKMPPILWDQILALLETVSESRTLAALNVTRPPIRSRIAISRQRGVATRLFGNILYEAIRIVN